MAASKIVALEARMLLHRFMCAQFGHRDLRSLLQELDQLDEWIDEDHVERFTRAMLRHRRSYAPAQPDELNRYGENIAAHSRSLGMTRERGRHWKPFQYLALLFTERYLDLYFGNREELLLRLNGFRQQFMPRVPACEMADLGTLALQSATGSGKTLLLHANILQYRHYCEKSGELHRLNKIILVTPDEGLSRQHLAELRGSNIAAELFSNERITSALPLNAVEVDIIDLHKLDEKAGNKRVPLAAFEDNNLVLVDEGHLGTGGRVWRSRRKELARNGFTFEYSATFNQAIASSGANARELRDEYGKALLFDYSYKLFYRDGYGKDYRISNLQNTEDGEATQVYLLACLLMFYQQCRLYRDKGGDWMVFNLAPPLWVFLGSTVTGNKSQKAQEIRSDVVRIVQFLAWVLANPKEVAASIGRLLRGEQMGLVDRAGSDIFADCFNYIKTLEETPANDSLGLGEKIYEDLCRTVFHGRGRLRVSHLPGTGELQLQAGTATNQQVFGVINVGDASGLYNIFEGLQDADFSLAKDVIAKPLFEQVDEEHSPVNVVIGARKFVAGWNSWRVSTMGLMHVGTGEGPQIIQMFGRGIRLKGHAMSLKRHGRLETAPDLTPADSENLSLLETLNIFGLKANYMARFREYLKADDPKEEKATLILPTTNRFAKSTAKKLRVLEKDKRKGEFACSDERPDLPEAEGDTVELDCYQHLEVLQSQDHQAEQLSKQSGRLSEKHLGLMNRQRIYHRVLERKRHAGWHNLGISRQAVDRLLAPNNQSWYRLFIPPERLTLSHYGRVREWEELAVDLICLHADWFWRNERVGWERQFLKMAPLETDHPNRIRQYELSVDKDQKEVVARLEELIRDRAAGEEPELMLANSLEVLNIDFHAYSPLLHANPKGVVQVSPIALNKGEADFVKLLKAVVDNPRPSILEDKSVYLMRNLSRGRGISLFADHNYYPDFILWLLAPSRQDILFIDPKGLQIYNFRTQKKVDLHSRIKETEKKIQRRSPNVHLHAYIWSTTNAEDIGADHKMSVEECHRQGIFFAALGEQEIARLIEHALGNPEQGTPA